MKPFDISAENLAQSLGIEFEILKKIISEKQNIEADTALRLAKYFGTTTQLRLGLQSDYDIDITRRLLGDRPEKEIIPLAA